MLLKISASRCRFTPFAGYFRATTSTEAVTPSCYPRHLTSAVLDLIKVMGVYEENIIPIKIARLAEYVSERKRISLDEARGR